jgi:hypothetical protein
MGWSLVNNQYLLWLADLLLQTHLRWEVHLPRIEKIKILSGKLDAKRKPRHRQDSDITSGLKE